MLRTLGRVPLCRFLQRDVLGGNSVGHGFLLSPCGVVEEPFRLRGLLDLISFRRPCQLEGIEGHYIGGIDGHYMVAQIHMNLWRE